MLKGVNSFQPESHPKVLLGNLVVPIPPLLLEGLHEAGTPIQPNAALLLFLYGLDPLEEPEVLLVDGLEVVSPGPKEPGLYGQVGEVHPAPCRQSPVHY
jgi:hypothetical protein